MALIQIIINSIKSLFIVTQKHPQCFRKRKYISFTCIRQFWISLHLWCNRKYRTQPSVRLGEIIIILEIHQPKISKRKSTIIIINIAWLNIPMMYPFFMQSSKCLTQLQNSIDDFIKRHSIYATHYLLCNRHCIPVIFHRIIYYWNNTRYYSTVISSNLNLTDKSGLFLFTSIATTKFF